MAQFETLEQLAAMHGRTVWFCRQVILPRMDVEASLARGRERTYTTHSILTPWKVGPFLLGLHAPRELVVMARPADLVTADSHVTNVHWDDANLLRRLVRVIAISPYLPQFAGEEERLSAVFPTREEAEVQQVLVALSGTYVERPDGSQLSRDKHCLIRSRAAPADLYRTTGRWRA